MKAGIYKTPNGNLIYVAKDRTIKATMYGPLDLKGTKASQRGSAIVVKDELCEHVSDVPNGCTDHQGWLDMFAKGFLQKTKYAVAGLQSNEVAAIITPGREMATADQAMQSARHILDESHHRNVTITVNPDAKILDALQNKEGVRARIMEAMQNPAFIEEAQRRLAAAGVSFDREGDSAHYLGSKEAWDETGPATRDAYKRFAHLAYLDLVKNTGADGERAAGMSPALGLPYGVNVFLAKTCGVEKEMHGRRYAIIESTPGIGEGPDSFFRRFSDARQAIDASAARALAGVWRDEHRKSLKRQGFRVCHGRSARKHRKQGHFVIQLRGGLFAWKPVWTFSQKRGYMEGACASLDNLARTTDKAAEAIKAFGKAVDK